MRKKTILKWGLTVVPLLFIAYVGFVIVTSHIEHRKLVEREIREFPAPGHRVTVNDDGDTLHVYSEGAGDNTLVFMSGWGTSSPYYDFKPLYRRLANDYRVSVVERAGYGWSDVTDSPRDLDTVLDETRTALRLAGENPPYVLFPHSLAGMEAIHWAHEYPDELTAIVGLDPLVPDYFEQADDPPSFSPVLSFLARSGLMRHNPGVFEKNFPAMEKGLLTDAEAAAAKAIFFRRVQTKTMRAELDALPENSRRLMAVGKPKVPFHAFIAADREADNWVEILRTYAHATGGEAVVLEGGHYIHLDKPAVVAEMAHDLLRR